MSDNQPPVFGENGAILNSASMMPQSEWPEPQPQRLTRKFWINMVIVLSISIVARAIIL